MKHFKKRKMDEDSAEYLPAFISKDFDNSEDSDNGLWLANTYVPEEVVLQILSYMEPKEVLDYSLVCRKWNQMIKSYALWSSIYKRKFNRKAKRLPWYLYYCLLSTDYFDRNLLQNGNGEDQFVSWEIAEIGGDEWVIEDPPVGADPLPSNVPEFHNKTSCFATNFFFRCFKTQAIKFGNSKLFRYILNSYKPHIYLSEWTASRFDCGCLYRLGCQFVGQAFSQELRNGPLVENQVTQWEGGGWKKVEVTIDDYPEGIEGIIFEHEGCDTQHWSGHSGNKMAGGVVKLLFNSMEELPSNEHGRAIPKTFTKTNFTTNATIRQRIVRRERDLLEVLQCFV